MAQQHGVGATTLRTRTCAISSPIGPAPITPSLFGCSCRSDHMVTLQPLLCSAYWLTQTHTHTRMYTGEHACDRSSCTYREVEQGRVGEVVHIRQPWDRRNVGSASSGDTGTSKRERLAVNFHRVSARELGFANEHIHTQFCEPLAGIVGGYVRAQLAPVQTRNTKQTNKEQNNQQRPQGRGSNEMAHEHNPSPPCVTIVTTRTCAP